jgi:hypothetical protein
LISESSQGCRPSTSLWDKVWIGPDEFVPL